jgi:S1-C subfamily serine protease
MKYFDLRFVIILLFIGGLSCSSNHFRTTDNISPSQTRKNILESQKSFIQFEAKLTEDIVVGYGSGFIVSSNEYGSYIMTAAHVCLLPEIIELNRGIPTVLNIKNYENEITDDVTIHYTDIDNDICVVKTKKFKNKKSVDIAQYQIEKGAEIYAITAPRGVSYLEYMTVPFHEGFFLGKKSESENIYSLRISYGSSGGMIISKRGEVVGIVQSKLGFEDLDQFDELTISPPLQAIKKAERSF